MLSHRDEAPRTTDLVGQHERFADLPHDRRDDRRRRGLVLLVTAAASRRSCGYLSRVQVSRTGRWNLADSRRHRPGRGTWRWLRECSASSSQHSCQPGRPCRSFSMTSFPSRVRVRAGAGRGSGTEPGLSQKSIVSAQGQFRRSGGPTWPVSGGRGRPRQSKRT